MILFMKVSYFFIYKYKNNKNIKNKLIKIMAKITKDEFLNNIHDIINEGMNINYDEKVDNTKKFNIHHYVTSLLEDGQRNPKLMTYLNNYHQYLNNNDVKEFMVFEQFGQGLAQFATNNKDVKRVINQMNETIDNYGHELEAYMIIEQIQNLASQDLVREAYDNYLESEDENSRDILIDAIDMVEAEGDPAAHKLTIIITADAENRLPKIEIGTSESKFNMIQQKIRDDKARKRMEEIQAQVDAYAKQVFDESEAAQEAARAELSFESIINNNGINLRESIKNIYSSEARSNKKLMETINQYAGALNQGLYEERLYESFVQNLSKYNYLLPVEKELARINEVASKNAASIDITKLLEEMSTTTSYYIIPLIEEDAVRYVKNPNDMNRVQLRNALCSFAADPYCKLMLEAIERNSYLLNGSADTIEDKSLLIADKIKLVRENANISAIYSPVQYIRENECVFNANGQFYVKKGNSLAKLSNEYLNQLSETFVSLCQLINDPRVIINEDSIVLVSNDKIATIYEGYVDINGTRETTDTLRNLNEMCIKYDFDTNFFIMTSCLHENFDNIAKINFGKHISLNENAGINIDMFRLGNNIFINTVNEDVNKSTFYHNVNPLQCRNIINSHMGINVASMFEDLIPSQEKIMLKLNETKNEYEASIEKYENTIEKLEKAQSESLDAANQKKLNDAIESAKKKVDELKKEYKDWQKQVEKTTTTNDTDDEDNDSQPTNEPLKDSEVDDAKPELLEPLTNGEDGLDVNEEDPVISDDEFESFFDDRELEDDGTEVEPEMEDEPTELEDNDTEVEPNMEDNETEMEVEPNMEDNETEMEVEPNMEVDGFEEINLDGDGELPAENTDDNDIQAIEPEMEDEPTEEETFDIAELDNISHATPEGYTISNVLFDHNLKTNELFKSGTVTVTVPMIDAQGKVFANTETYNFYINEESNEPILDSEELPLALYNAIIATIKENEMFDVAISNGKSAVHNFKDNIYYDAKDVEAASEILDNGEEEIDIPVEIEEEPTDEIFNIEEDPEEGTLTISSKEDTPVEIEDNGSSVSPEDLTLDDIFANMEDDENPEEEETEEIIIPTYKSEDGKTDIELPAPTADGTAIRESKKSNFLKASAVIKKGDQHFFLNEGTIKPSKKQNSQANENVDGISSITEDSMYDPYEEYNEEMDLNTIDIMHTRAANALDAAYQQFKHLKITPVEEVENLGLKYFTMELRNNKLLHDSYTCYQVNNKIFYKPSEEFYDIINTYEDENLCMSELTMRADDPTESLDYVDINNTTDCKFLVDNILMLLGIDINEEINESIKVRKLNTKLHTNDFEKSKKVYDIVNGDKNERDFRKKVERETEKAGVPNPLIPPAQEQYTQVLPNVHAPLTEAKQQTNADEKVEYQPKDWVIIKELNMKAQVNAVVHNGDGELTMLTVLATNGILYDVDYDEIMPDPAYIENIPGREINSTKLTVPRLSVVDYNPETRLAELPKNEKPATFADLNGKTTPVNIVVEGYKLTSIPVSAFVEDIANSKQFIRVINENGEINSYDVNKNIEFEEMPYAVLIDNDGKPVRTIKIDPLSYINAEEDELVDCTVADKATKYPKSRINVLS